MATKNTTTKAKTKTTKRKTKKTTAAKAMANKSQVKAAAAKKDSKTKKTDLKSINFSRIRSLNLMSIGLFILLAIAVGYLMNNQSYQLTISYLAADSISGEVAPASRALLDLELKWYLVGLLALSAVLPLLYVTKLSNSYEKQLTKSRYVPWRWIDSAIIGSFLIFIIALLSGIQNLYLLKLLGGFVIISAVFGWMSERGDVVATRKKTSYKASLFSSTVPWVVIAVTAIASFVYGGAVAPWYVYALYFVVALGVITAHRVQFKELNADTRNKNYLEVERSYLMNSIATRTLVVVILIFALLK